MRIKADLRKHTLNLYEGDLDKLAALHPDLDKSVVVRELVRSHIERAEQEAPAQKMELKTNV